LPAAEAAKAAAAGGADALSVMRAATEGAKAGAAATEQMESRRGRSKKLGARSVGHVDPGAASAHVMLEAMTKALEAKG
ncbi:MAG: DAK2 domain-containing protein, partial [Tropicimonas sp.]